MSSIIPYDFASSAFKKLSRSVSCSIFLRVLPVCLAKHTGKTLKKIEQDTDRDNFLNADEAKSYGIIDDILDSRDDTKDGK